jgi:hypothetical protein
MTYPDEKAYVDSVDAGISESGLNYRIFREKMNDEDVARLRIVSEITVNNQTAIALNLIQNTCLPKCRDRGKMASV